VPILRKMKRKKVYQSVLIQLIVQAERKTGEKAYAPSKAQSVRHQVIRPKEQMTNWRRRACAVSAGTARAKHAHSTRPQSSCILSDFDGRSDVKRKPQRKSSRHKWHQNGNAYIREFDRTPRFKAFRPDLLFCHCLPREAFLERKAFPFLVCFYHFVTSIRNIPKHKASYHTRLRGGTSICHFRLRTSKCSSCLVLSELTSYVYVVVKSAGIVQPR